MCYNYPIKSELGEAVLWRKIFFTERGGRQRRFLLGGASAVGGIFPAGSASAESVSHGLFRRRNFATAASPRTLPIPTKAPPAT